MRCLLRRIAPVRAVVRGAGLAGDARGSTIIEYALVAAPLIALLLASLETALVFFVQEALETSVEAAARTVTTGATQSSDAVGQANGLTNAQMKERFRQNACATLPVFLSCSKLLVDVESASTFGGINTSKPTITYDANGVPTNNFAYNTGSQGAIVMVRLIYPWPLPIGPMAFNLTDGSGNRLMIATSVSKTEAYT